MPRGISRRVGSRQLPVTSYVVLGLIGHKPGGGYSLATFAARSISHMWPITRSQVYAELPRLESLGLIAGTNVMQEKLPDKCTYELTDAGTDALLRCARERQHHFQELVDRLADRPDSFFPRLTALHAVRRAEAEEAWATEARGLLAARQSAAVKEI